MTLLSTCLMTKKKARRVRAFSQFFADREKSVRLSGSRVDDEGVAFFGKHYLFERGVREALPVHFYYSPCAVIFFVFLKKEYLAVAVTCRALVVGHENEPYAFSRFVAYQIPVLAVFGYRRFTRRDDVRGPVVAYFLAGDRDFHLGIGNGFHMCFSSLK